ncbi:MAG TPA: M28 family peptidase [Gaiellaceae bacterium]
MPQHVRTRRSRIWLALLCIVSGAGVFGLTAGGGTAARSVTTAQCDSSVNDTAAKLVPCIKQNDLWKYMQDFQAIANANPSPADGHPSRNSGEPGYKASADYVASLMKSWGYDVTIQQYTFTYYAYTATPSFSEVSPTAHQYVLADDWNPGQSTGTANAAVQPAGGIVIPPTSSPSSSSGCTASDFSGFTPGRIALIQRGTCNFGVKVQNAQAAGASGVIIFNEGNPGRTGVINGSLIDAAGNPIIPTIPVAFTSYAIGLDLYNQSKSAPVVMNISIRALVQPNAPDYNVIADSKGGDKNHVVVVDAHLDAIYGAGMLDNASGSTTILDIARMMRNVTPTNKLRFTWFGGEELGLFGSAAYINSLSSNDLSHIGYDLDADVTATPNYIIGVLDPAAPDFFGGTVTTQFPNRVYKASTVSRDEAVGYFDSIGKNHEFLGPTGTDAYNFNLAGIPAGGLLTGQDCCKTQHEVDLFGGSLGNYEGNVPSFDGGCVDNPFRWCDNLSNNDPTVLTFMSKAFATMVVDMAFDTKVMSASDNTVYNKKLPIASETTRHSSAK